MYFGLLIIYPIAYIIPPMGFKETFRTVDRNIDIPLSMAFIVFGILANQYIGIIGGGLGLMRALIQRKIKSGPQEIYGLSHNAEIHSHVEDAHPATVTTETIHTEHNEAPHVLPVAA
jgi:hypothetical protein